MSRVRTINPLRRALVISCGLIIGWIGGWIGGGIIGEAIVADPAPQSTWYDNLMPRMLFSEEKVQRLELCDSNYHGNVGCPGHDKIRIPQEVLEREAAEYLEWCNSNYHQNVGCPGHDNIRVPEEYLVELADPQRLMWCDRIYHGEPPCPRYPTDTSE